MYKKQTSKFKEVEYKLILDNDGCYLSGIHEYQKSHGGSIPLTYILDELTEAKIIFSLGRQFSRSKRWQSVWRQASDLIYQYQQSPEMEISEGGRVWQ